ncbi:MAG: iron-containing alcohol dehydrogenase [Lachnospiraceae bacterium]|nr:iron-containing alcohol dehydrogenase [Lachnospiraceae bacterium]
MFILKIIGCRTFQTAFRMVLPVLPYREPEIVGSCSELGAVLKKEAIRTLLIVTDPGIVRSGLVSFLEETLKNEKIAYFVYDKTQPNPTVRNVEEAFRQYRENHCDGLIAIGGGSSMDCAKALGARISCPKKSVGRMKGILRVLRRLPPLVAIPTTAGTGSETTLAAVITDGDKHHKYALMSFPLIPRYAVLDAKLTYSLPPHLTATTGMDALTHAVEAYIGRSTTKKTRRLAREAVRLVFENVENAYKNGRDHKARERMLLAAYKAGIAFSKSYVGYIHAIAHSLGGRYGTPHGLANAVIMPYVLEAYGERTHRKLHELAVAAGISDGGDSHGAGAGKFLRAIRELNKKMGIPDKLTGIRKEDIPAMAKHAEKEANPLYPVPVLLTAKELERFYYRIADWSDGYDRPGNTEPA